MFIAAGVIAGLVVLACGIAFGVHLWLKVDPVPLASDASDAERIQAVDRWLDEQFERFRFNGGVLVVRDGKVLLSKTCGYTDHTATQRLNDHSAFPLASVSKQFTAAGVLRLVELGRLELDDPVVKYLDGVCDERVTIRHLLRQTSGIPDEYMNLAERNPEALGEVLTISKVVELLRKHPLAGRAPGEAMEYSNTNYVLLAAVIEFVSGTSFERYMAEELFGPLGMNDTRVWTLLSGERSPNQVRDFDQIDDERTAVEPTWLDGVAGDGAVFCSLHDFVIWDRFWYGNRFVSAPLLREAFERPTLNDGSESVYGFGWVIEPERQWHNGAWLGAKSHVARYPESRGFLVVLDNSSNLRFDKIVREIERALNPILLGD